MVRGDTLEQKFEGLSIKVNAIQLVFQSQHRREKRQHIRGPGFHAPPVIKSLSYRTSTLYSYKGQYGLREEQWA